MVSEYRRLKQYEEGDTSSVPHVCKQAEQVRLGEGSQQLEVRGDRAEQLSGDVGGPEEPSVSKSSGGSSFLRASPARVA